MLFQDNFEDGNYDGWIDAGSGTKEVTSLTAALGTNYSYHESNSPSGHYNGVYQDLGGVEAGYISFYMRSGATNKADAYFVLRNSSGSDAIFFFAHETGDFYVNDYTTYAYNPLTWYHIEFKNINLTTKTFDFYVDGILVKQDILFRNSSSSTTAFDRLELYKGPG